MSIGLGPDGRGLVVADQGLSADGFWLGPTLLDNVTPDMSVYTDEIFGPVLSVLRVDTYDEALELINANPYGNGTAIFTNDGGAARRFQNEVEVGMVGINVPIRTVLLTSLSKYDGVKPRLLTAREFHQIGGRAGRAGYDAAGTVVIEAPDHVVANEKALAKAGDDPKKRRKVDQFSALPLPIVFHLILPCFSFTEQVTDVGRVNKTLHGFAERIVLPWMNARFHKGLVRVKRQDRVEDKQEENKEKEEKEEKEA